MMSGQKEFLDLVIAVEIDNFLSGNSDGAALFQALYGAAAAEPIPERLLAVLRTQSEPACVAEPVPAAAPALDAATT